MHNKHERAVCTAEEIHFTGRAEYTFAQIAAVPPPLRALGAYMHPKQDVCYTAIHGGGVATYARWHAGPDGKPELRAVWEERDEDSPYLRDLPKPPMGSNVLL